MGCQANSWNHNRLELNSMQVIDIVSTIETQLMGLIQGVLVKVVMYIFGESGLSLKLGPNPGMRAASGHIDSAPVSRCA